MGRTPADVRQMMKEHAIEAVDIRFMDFPGLWQHFSVPPHEMEEDAFEEGLGFDGSSIRGWQSIHQSDMCVVPDPDTAFIDPFTEHPTLVLIGNIVDPITRQDYSRDPRNVARKAESYLKSTGIADTAYYGPEPEFFIFDEIRFGAESNEAFYSIDSVEGFWNTGTDEGPNLGHRPRYKEGYFPCPPTDHYQDLRTEMVANMEKCGIIVEKQHHEVATAGQAEIDFRFCPLVECADQLAIFKYVVKNTARLAGKTATFMPKPIYGDNGSGMHTHFSLWKADKPLFFGEGYAGLSDQALWSIGGILKHAAALTAFTNATTNSYKRLVPGFEAPVNLAYSSRNRSAAIRIPMYSHKPAAKRFECRFPDATGNPYLSFAALLMAALDGIQNKIHPGEPLDKDIYDLPPEELANVPHTPHSLDEALDALAEDHEFLLKGDVMTEDVVSTWIKYKRETEVDELRLRPHPYEFYMYYGI